ncbi:MAG TPA: hypothetical protein VNP93_06465, partial [Gaiellaceae bacterium]|nr:hypothetical protein [Gaiellaceae bacterium]
ELRRLLRFELGQKRFGPQTTLESLDEAAAGARDDGVSEDVITYYSALVAGRSDRDEGRRRLRRLEEREPRWGLAYESALQMFERRDG